MKIGYTGICLFYGWLRTYIGTIVLPSDGTTVLPDPLVQALKVQQWKLLRLDLEEQLR